MENIEAMASYLEMDARFEEELVRAYEKELRRKERYFAMAKRMLAPSRYDALLDEYRETDGTHSPRFTKQVEGEPQEPICDDGTFVVYVDQRCQFEDSYYGTVFFPVKDGWWFAFGFSC